MQICFEVVVRIGVQSKSFCVEMFPKMAYSYGYMQMNAEASFEKYAALDGIQCVRRQLSDLDIG